MTLSGAPSRAATLAAVFLLSSCSACEEEPEVGGTCISTGGVPCECPDGRRSCTDLQDVCDCPEEEPLETVEIPVDDDNRFVQEDLDAFLEAYPDVVSESDREQMRTCVGDACIGEIPEDVDSFDGEGVRYLVPLWFRACLSGSGAGCLAAAQTYNGSTIDDHPVHEGMSREALNDKTHQYATRACELSEDQCRMWASQTLSADESTAADVARAIILLRAECEAGGFHACGLLGRNADAHSEAIGTARQWYEKACALEEGAPFNRYCDDYGQILFATGNRADREEAARILTPICDVTSEAWASECEGDAEAGTQECSTFEMRFGESCALHAATLPPEQAVPIFAALCRELAISDEELEENNARCQNALRLARRSGRTDAYMANVLNRACDAIETRCNFDNAFDLEMCGATRQRCMDDGPS